MCVCVRLCACVGIKVSKDEDVKVCAICTASPYLASYSNQQATCLHPRNLSRTLEPFYLVLLYLQQT